MKERQCELQNSQTTWTVRWVFEKAVVRCSESFSLSIEAGLAAALLMFTRWYSVVSTLLTWMAGKKPLHSNKSRMLFSSTHIQISLPYSNVSEESYHPIKMIRDTSSRLLAVGALAEHLPAWFVLCSSQMPLVGRHRQDQSVRETTLIRWLALQITTWEYQWIKCHIQLPIKHIFNWKWL